MPKPSGAFTGIKLTEPLAPPEDRLDQQLFSDAATPPVPPKPKGTAGRRQAKNLPSLQSTKETTLEPRKQGNLENAVGEALPFDLNIPPYKNDTFAFTTEELEAIEDIKLELRRRLDLPATKNDIVRCAIHSLVEDHRRRGPHSLVVQRIRNKRGR